MVVIIGEKAIGADQVREFGWAEVGNLEVMVITGDVVTGDNFFEPHRNLVEDLKSSQCDLYYPNVSMWFKFIKPFV